MNDIISLWELPEWRWKLRQRFRSILGFSNNDEGLAGVLEFRTPYFTQDCDFYSRQLYLTSYRSCMFGTAIPNFDCSEVEKMDVKKRREELKKKVSREYVQRFYEEIEMWFKESTASNEIMVFPGKFTVSKTRGTNVYFFINMVTRRAVICSREDATRNPMYLTARQLSLDEFYGIVLRFDGITLPANSPI